MNVVKIIRSLRDLKILMNNSLLNADLKNYLRHAEKNLIDLENTSDLDEDEVDFSNSVNVEEIELNMSR